MSNFSRLYVKYLIKTPVIFFLFLFTGVALFLYLTLHVNLDVTESYEAFIVEDIVTIPGEHEVDSDTIYLYNDRNEVVYQTEIENAIIQDGNTVIDVENSYDLSGEIYVDIVVGEETLLERIFVKAGKR